MAENARLRRDLLISKSSGLVCPGQPGKAVSVYRFMEANRAEFSVLKMAAVLEVARSGYYRWLGQSQQRAEVENKTRALIMKLCTAHAECRGRYGARRLH